MGRSQRPYLGPPERLNAYEEAAAAHRRALHRVLRWGIGRWGRLLDAPFGGQLSRTRAMRDLAWEGLTNEQRNFIRERDGLTLEEGSPRREVLRSTLLEEAA